MKRTILSAVMAAGLVAGVAFAAAPSPESARAGSQLVRGWNNVAYLGAAKPPTEALSSINGSYDAVYRWNSAEQKYELYAPSLPSQANTLKTISPGDAIWVNLTAESGSLPQGSGGGGGGGAALPLNGHISIAASTFMPMSDLAVYQKSFNQIYPVGTDEFSKRYIAPVNLPDGVSIHSMTAAYEASGGDVQVRLDYTPIGNGDTPSQIFKLVEVLSNEGASPRKVTAFAHTVDNAANVYFIVVDLTGGPGTKLRGVSIAYGED
jgi:opacity protein-like surface antigen